MNTPIQKLDSRDYIVAHMINSIEKSVLSSKPYRHIYFEDFFPDNIYAQFRSNFPSDELYKDLHHRDANLADGTSTRKVMPFNESILSRLDGPKSVFWSSIRDALSDPKLKYAFFKKLDNLAKTSATGLQPQNIEAYPKGGLFRDKSGYKILPHKDTKRKIITSHIYLPQDASQRSFGTTLYSRSLAERLRYELSKVGLRSNKPVFSTVKTFPFMPNSGYAFVVGNNSWHGREPIPETTSDRYSLMNIYYRNPDEKFYD